MSPEEPTSALVDGTCVILFEGHFDLAALVGAQKGMTNPDASQVVLDFCRVNLYQAERAA
jgi:hypothetical protein